MTTNLFWSDEEKTIRGSFVNLTLTFIITVFIIWGMFDSSISLALKENQSLITWFFGLSWSIYSVKTVADKYIINK